jgi:hypothetical protein
MRRVFLVFATLLALGVNVSVAKAGGIVGLSLDTGASSLNLGLLLNGGNILIPESQPLPLSSGGLTLNVGAGQISNISGLLADGLGITLSSPWVINTALGPLSLSGGHISIGPGPGPYTVSGSNVDLGGLGVTLDGGAGSILGAPFDFGADPVNFLLPSPTAATFEDFGGGLYTLTIPVEVREDTEVNLGVGPVPLSYIISGQVVFTNVPEPSAFSLLAVAGLGLIARRRR